MSRVRRQCPCVSRSISTPTTRSASSRTTRNRSPWKPTAWKVVIEPHSFFMAMYANEMSLFSIRDLGDGRRVAKLTGDLGCLTEAGTATGRVGSREAEEPAFFEIEATDGGHGGGAARDSFVFTVFFDPDRAPLNHAIFGPNPAFTGEMIAGEITIAAPAALPLISGTPAP